MQSDQELLKRRLASLLRSGCLLTVRGGYSAVLADAFELPGNRLWYFEAFGESTQHVSAIIEIDGHRATIDGGRWECEDLQTLEQLRALDQVQYLPDAVNAYAAVKVLKGKIISAEPEEPETDEEGRQLIH